MARHLQSQKPPPSVYHDDPNRDDAASISSALSLRDHAFLDNSDNEEPPSYTDEPGGRTASNGKELSPALGHDWGLLVDLESLKGGNPYRSFRIFRY